MKPFAVFVLTALAALGACSTPSPPTKVATTTSSDRKCFFGNDVNSFEAIDENFVNIKVGANDVYQLTIFGPCFDIDWAQRIALVTRGGTSVCTGQATAEIVSQTPSGPRRCQIQSVRYLTPQEVAALPKGQKP